MIFQPNDHLKLPMKHRVNRLSQPIYDSGMYALPRCWIQGVDQWK